MKEDKSEVLATSDDLCNPNQTILIAGDDDYVLIHTEKKVNQGFFSSKFSIFQQVFLLLDFVVFHFFIKIPQKSVGNRSD